MLSSFTLAALAATQIVVGAATDPVAALPDVESVLTKATGKVHDFAEQAIAMQRRVAQQQDKSRQALAAQKATYESKLAEQDARSEAISANNTVIDRANKALQASISGLEVEVRFLQDGNNKMRKSLQGIDSKVQAATAFLMASLKDTDDTDAEELKVLKPTTPKPTLDHFLAVAAAATGLDKLSLLQFSRSSPRSSGPEDLVDILSKSLADIATAEVEGAAELKSHFLSNFEDGQKRQEALNMTQAKLLELQSELKIHQGKLIEAKTHLEATRKQLRDRLEGLRTFARKVDSAALSTLENTTVPTTLATSAKAPAKVAPAPAAAAPVIQVATVAAATKKQEKPAAKKPVKPASKKSEKPKKAAFLQTHQDHRDASALRKPSGASVPKPQKRHGPPKAAPKAASKPSAASSKLKQQHRKRPEPTALLQASSTRTTETKVPEQSFMSTWLSALR